MNAIDIIRKELFDMSDKFEEALNEIFNLEQENTILREELIALQKEKENE